MDGMGGYSADDRRVVRNAAYLYVRMLFVLAIGLYTPRVVLDALGVEDSGIYSVIALGIDEYQELVLSILDI